MLCSCIALLTLARGLGLDQTVDLEIRGMPLARALTEISAKTDVKLSADSGVGAQTVAVYVHGVKAGDLLDKLASTLEAKWRIDASGRRLVPDEDRRKLDKAAVLRQRAEEIRGMFDPMLQRLSPKFDQSTATALIARLKSIRQDRGTGPGYEFMRRTTEAGLEAPYGRLVLRLMKTVPAETLAEMEPGDRWVFALKPTPRQHGFGKGAEEAMRDFVREQGVWSAALTSVNFERDGSEFVMDPMVQTEPFEADPTKVYIVVKRAESQAYMCNLMMPTDHGPQILTQVSPRSAKIDKAFGMLDKPGEKDLPIDTTPETDAIAAAFASRRFGERAVAMSADVLDRLCDPVKFDPLGYMATDGLFTLAKAGRRNLVAWLPDELFSISAVSRQGKMQLNAFRQIVTTYPSGVDIVDGNEWMLVTPKDPVATVSRQEDREAVRAALRAVRAKGSLHMIDYARYAASARHERLEGFGLALMMLLDPAAGSVVDGSDWNAIRLYGSLTDVQRVNLENGKTIPYSGLTARQKQLVEEISFDDAINNYAHESTNMMRVDHPQLEPTIYLSQGVPANSELAMQVDSKDVLFAYAKNAAGGLGVNRTIDPETIAWFEYEKEHPTPGEPMRGQQPLVAYQVGKQMLYRIRIVYDKAAWNEYKMAENRPPTNKAPVPWQQLPEDLKSRVEAGLKRHREDAATKTKADPPPPR